MVARDRAPARQVLYIDAPVKWVRSPATEARANQVRRYMKDTLGKKEVIFNHNLVQEELNAIDNLRVHWENRAAFDEFMNEARAVPVLRDVWRLLDKVVELLKEHHAHFFVVENFPLIRLMRLMQFEEMANSVPSEQFYEKDRFFVYHRGRYLTIEVEEEKLDVEALKAWAQGPAGMVCDVCSDKDDVYDLVTCYCGRVMHMGCLHFKEGGTFCGRCDNNIHPVFKIYMNKDVDGVYWIDRDTPTDDEVVMEQIKAKFPPSEVKTAPVLFIGEGFFEDIIQACIPNSIGEEEIGGMSVGDARNRMRYVLSKGQRISGSVIEENPTLLERVKDLPSFNGLGRCERLQRMISEIYQ